MRKLKKPYSQNWRGLSAKWLFILSTVLGIIAGTCFWIFISRCGNEECFLNYDPLPEMFIGGVIGVRGVKRNAINRVVRKNDNDFDN